MKTRARHFVEMSEPKVDVLEGEVHINGLLDSDVIPYNPRRRELRGKLPRNTDASAILSPAEARRLARSLLAQADQAERWRSLHARPKLTLRDREGKIYERHAGAVATTLSIRAAVSSEPSLIVPHASPGMWGDTSQADAVGDEYDTLTHEFLHAWLDEVRLNDSEYADWVSQHKGEDGLHYAIAAGLGYGGIVNSSPRESGYYATKLMHVVHGPGVWECQNCRDAVWNGYFPPPHDAEVTCGEVN